MGLSSNRQKTVLIILLTLFFFILSGCASSTVSRNAASQVDRGVEDAKDLVDGPNGNITDAYQNASQTTKGAVIGGAAGALTGTLSSGGVGFFAGTAIGTIIGLGYGSYIDYHTTLADQLDNRGVTIVVLGDHILMVLPSARIFNALTAEIKPDAYSTLNLVTHYINQYYTMLVKIAAYTNNSGSLSLDLILSEQQAKEVARFLLASGVNTRVLYAKGYGGTHLVEQNNPTWTDNQNYRIEITFEALYV